VYAQVREQIALHGDIEPGVVLAGEAGG
jgi:hypothetical protein